jgi:hypothetical protein
MFCATNGIVVLGVRSITAQLLLFLQVVCSVFSSQHMCQQSEKSHRNLDSLQVYQYLKEMALTHFEIILSFI